MRGRNRTVTDVVGTKITYENREVALTGYGLVVEFNI